MASPEDGGIIKVRKRAGYFTASDRAFNDERLAWDERGLMGYLLSKPGDWEVRFWDLVKKGDCGRDAVRRMLRNLERYGYVRRFRQRVGGGRFRWVTEVYESPEINPFFAGVVTSDVLGVTGESPVTGEPAVAEPAVAEPAVAGPSTARASIYKDRSKAKQKQKRAEGTAQHHRTSADDVDDELTFEQGVALARLLSVAPDFDGAREFVQRWDPKCVAYWCYKADESRSELRNLAGFIRAGVESGDWPVGRPGWHGRWRSDLEIMLGEASMVVAEMEV